jgi:hypothetical protein
MMIFKNDQWAVTDWGLEALLPGAPSDCLIPASRLLEMGGIGNNKLYDWPLHLAEKTWTDIEAFNEAFVKALELHKGKYRGLVDLKMLRASIDSARERARHTSLRPGL